MDEYNAVILFFLQLKAQSAALLSFELSRLLGLDECGAGSDTTRLLIRLLTPVAKLYTAKVAMSVTSEGLECFGGQGYIEDTGLPSMLRDAQVVKLFTSLELSVLAGLPVTCEIKFSQRTYLSVPL